jgi:hypothetical protein
MHINLTEECEKLFIELKETYLKTYKRPKYFKNSDMAEICFKAYLKKLPKVENDGDQRSGENLKRDVGTEEDGSAGSSQSAASS